METGRHLAVIHIVDSLERGGMERVVTDLAIEQARHGHRVKVFSLNETDGFRAELERAGIPVVIGGKRRAFDLRLLRTLRGLARSFGADIVHTHNFVPNYYAAAALLGDPRALVNTCHNMGGRLSNARLRALYRWSLGRSRRLAFVGGEARDALLASGWIDGIASRVVPNGVPLRAHLPVPQERTDARAAIGIADDALLIGCVGRLVGLKNHRAIIAELPDLARAFPGLRLAIAGEGPLEHELRGQAESLGVGDRVVLLGARSDVPFLLPAFDVFALPSTTEGLSIALLEACAAGLAIVASRVGGNPEVVEDGRTGRLFPSGDAAALNQALRELLADPDTRTRYGLAARQWVEDNGSIGAMRARYDAFYEDALAARH